MGLHLFLLLDSAPCSSIQMAPMKSMKATSMKSSGATNKAMTKGALLKAIAEEQSMKTKACAGVLETLVSVATKEVKKTGIFTIPGICRIKTRTKPATKAGVRMAFGQEIKVMAKPAKLVVKAFPVAALKQQI